MQTRRMMTENRKKNPENYFLLNLKLPKPLNMTYSVFDLSAHIAVFIH